MPNWTTPVPPDNLIIRRTYWRTQVIDNMRVLNDFFGNTNGAHASFTDGGVLLGSGQGAFTAMAALDKGDIIAGDGATDPTERSVGNNDELLRGESSEASGLVYEEINWRVVEYMLYG